MNGDLKEIEGLLLQALSKLRKLKGQRTHKPHKKHVHLTESQVREIFFSKKLVPELAKEFQRSVHMIYLIKRGATHRKWTEQFKREII